jgi:hypothetical protein
VSVLAFGNRINGPAWAREIAKIGLAGWTDTRASNTDDGQIEIDLSSARSADFLVLGRLLILIQALYESGAEVVVRMPRKGRLPAEQGYLDNKHGFPDGEKEAVEVQISRHQLQRINCGLFMEQSGFEAALRTGPLSDEAIKIDWEGSGETQPEASEAAIVARDEYDVPRPPQRQRGIIPYRWIDLSNPSSKPADITDQILRSIKGLGLAPDDAEAVAQGILAELIENARDHAYQNRQSDACILIGGELTQPQSYSRRIDDFDRELQSLVGFASDQQSPLLRLFIGDNGIGIEDPDSGIASGEAILEAFNLHASHAELNREAQGLWKAARIANTFQGSLLVTSGSATAGHIHDNPSVDSPLPARLPGTIVESVILTAVKTTILRAPGQANQPHEERSAVQGSAPVSTIGPLFCITTTLYQKLGLDPIDRSVIRHQLDEPGAAFGGGLVVLVEISPSTGPAAESDIESVIRSVLDITNETANASPVALVFPGVSRRILELAIDSLTARQGTESQVESSGWDRPVLIVSPENAHYWIGGKRVIRDLLSELSQAGETRLRISKIAGPLDVERDNGFERQIREQSQLLQLDNGLIILRLRPQDALDALAKDFSGRVVGAMGGEQSPGVRKGYYLTTSLRDTTRWINSRDLLQHLHLYQIAGLLLANAVAKDHILAASAPGFRVIRVDLDEQTASAFSLALTGDPRAPESIGEHQVASGVLAENPMQPVIVCTDVISRGAYVRRTVRELWNMGFTQVSVATLIDGRDLTFVDESREFLKVRGQKVPLVSLAFVSLDPDIDEFRDSGQEPQPIDPVTGTPLPNVYPHSRTIGKQELYIAAIKESGAARLGHIHRTGPKHFSAYVSPSTLFDYKPWEESTLDRIVRSIGRDNQQIQPTEDPQKAVVIYPAESKDDFARVVYSLTDAIDKAGIRCFEPIAIPRSLTGGEWAYPRFVRLPEEATHIVALDATSKTGRTLRELIRIASVPGVKFISCFGLIHGMNDLAAMSLQQVRQVAAYSMEHPSTHPHQLVPVEVRYLVRTAVSGEDAAKCPVCRLQRTYTSLPAVLPKSMSDYRAKLSDLLALRSKDDVFEELATDLFGVHLGQQDCIDFLEWRSDLEEARFSTKRRADVVDRISELYKAIDSRVMDEKARRERDSLIRLMAAEHSRLDQAPMWFTSVRVKLVEITRSLIELPDARINDPMLRVQALVVLARADRHLFCDEYSEIVRMCRDHGAVLAHALLEALALLAEERESASWYRSLTEQIAVSLEEVENESSEPSSWAFGLTEELTYLAAFATRGRCLSPNSKQQAWAELRKFCDSVRRHKYDQALWRLQHKLEGSRDLSDSSRANAVKDWQQCSIAIEESILPNLGILRSVLSSNNTLQRRLPSEDDRWRWRNIVEGEGSEELNRTAVKIGLIFAGSEPNATTQADRKDVMTLLDRWSDFFFQSPPTSGNPLGTSILSDIIEQCPTDLLESLREVFIGSPWDMSLQGIRDDEAVPVFCSSTALLDALTHIRMNAEETHRKDAQAPRFHIRVSTMNPDYVVVDLLNSGTGKDRKGGGRGLRIVAESLAAFDCCLEVIQEVPSGMSYGIRLTAERWKWS